MKEKISSGTIARTIILVLALFNQVLAIFGKSPLDIAGEDISNVVSLIFTIAAAIAAWWKNNSFTAAAIMADDAMTKINSRKNESDPTLDNTKVVVVTNDGNFRCDPGPAGPIGGPKEGE